MVLLVCLVASDMNLVDMWYVLKCLWLDHVSLALSGFLHRFDALILNDIVNI